MRHLAVVILVIWWLSTYGCETFGLPPADMKINVEACPSSSN